MAFLLLSTGQIYEVEGTHDEVVGVIADNPVAATGIVRGAGMTFRTPHIVAVAETAEQVEAFVLPGSALTPSENLPTTEEAGDLGT
jgi:hypothetical protein